MERGLLLTQCACSIELMPDDMTSDTADQIAMLRDRLIILNGRPPHAASQSPTHNRKRIEEFERKANMSFRIDRLLIAEDRVILRISGRITGQDADLLGSLLKQEATTVAIDLKDVLLVDREVVKLLALWESNGIELRNCATYIRELITRERADADSSETRA